MRISCCHYFMEPASNSGTPAIQRFCCGVGHVIDDILRQLLFSFRLVFFMKVLSLSAANAGWLILQKQLAHVVFSPLCAFLVDSINIPVLSRKLGRRKSWLLIANIVEAVFIPLFFSTCFPCQSGGGQWQRMVYIGVLNTILAFGGALMNVGHLSIIPVIAKNQSEAVEMSAWRFVIFSVTQITKCRVQLHFLVIYVLGSRSIFGKRCYFLFFRCLQHKFMAAVMAKLMENGDQEYQYLKEM